MKNFLFFLSIFSSITTTAQEIPIGTWRSHFTSTSVTHITNSTSAVFGASNNSILVYDWAADEINTIDKVSGLSSVGLSDIFFHQPSETLVISYQDGNLDFFDGVDVINNPSLLLASNINQKGINELVAFGESVLVAADFGVLVVDPSTGEIVESWINLGNNGSSARILGSVISKDSIFLNTDQGVIVASQNNGSNLKDFRSWSTIQGLTNIDHIALLAGKLYATVTGQGVFQYQNGTWTLVSNVYNQIRFLESIDEQLLILNGPSAIGMSISNQFNEISNSTLTGNEISKVGSVFWLADGERGIVNLNQEQVIQANGPPSDLLYQTKAFDEVLLTLPGAFSSLGMPQNRFEPIGQFGSGAWSTIDDFIAYGDIVDGIYETASDRFVLASFTSGVIVKDESGIQVWDASNSSLSAASGGQQTQVSAVALNENTNELYVANYGSTEPIHVLRADGSWEGFPFSSQVASQPVEMEIDQFGMLYVRLGITGSGGILVFDPATGNSKILNQTLNNGAIISNRVTSIALDLEDELWIGTDKGPIFIPIASATLSFDEVNAIRPIFESNFLLKDEWINDIEIDPGNRKWMATNRGAWLFDPNGEELFYQFDSQNSPLPSDKVLDISVLPSTGEVFFLTDVGMVSFRADATFESSSKSNVEVFPNPVNPSYEGVVGIRGVTNNAILKITNAAGQLVKEIRAYGNSASWDLRDFKGSRVTTGVYLIFSSDQDGENGLIGKVAVLR